VAKLWKRLPQATYGKSEAKTIGAVEKDLRDHMAKSKLHRYEHSLSVATTAEGLAAVYGVDPFQARVAGLLHDWHKVYSAQRQIEMAQELGIDLGVPMELVSNLLHGMITSQALPERYPDLPVEVWQAIARHTTAAVDMSPLDMVLFVADGIEPLRRSTPGIDAVRARVGKASLDELYWTSFVGGVVYVLETERYLYPGTLDIYNQGVLERSSKG
jgi:predicted HD superfamily hydrolase involved in NAD metabolism